MVVGKRIGPAQAAPDHMSGMYDDDCLQELPWLHDRRNSEQARSDLAACPACWQVRSLKLTAWVEYSIAENFAVYSLPLQRHSHLTSTKVPVCVSQDIYMIHLKEHRRDRMRQAAGTGRTPPSPSQARAVTPTTGLLSQDFKKPFTLLENCLVWSEVRIGRNDFSVFVNW